MILRQPPLLLALLAITLTAQDPVKPAPPQEERGVIVWKVPAQIVHYEHRAGLLYVLGDVEAEIDGRYLRCDNLICWIRKQEKKPGDPPDDPSLVPPGADEAVARAQDLVSEIYAEGHVVYKQDGEWFYCDRLYLDVQRDRGLVIDGTVAIPMDTRDGPMPLVVKAQELRILSRNRLQAAGVRSWVGPHGRPFTNVTSDQIEVIKELGVGDPEDPNRSDNYHITANGNVLRLGEFPVMWAPDFVWDTAARRVTGLVESVRLNRSQEFGYEAGLTLGQDIELENGRKWGNWNVHADWYSNRGPGVGVDLVYATDDYRGIFYSRYQRDTGNDENFGDPPTNDRGRLSWWHRHQLPGGVQLDLEMQLFSDRGYYPTFYENQEKGLKPPENLVYLKKVFFNQVVSGLLSSQFNDWLTTVEHQPELRYDLITEPLFDIADHPLYLSVAARGGHARLEPDEDLGSSPGGTWRVDVDTLIEYAFPLDPFKITPFAGLRYTYWEQDLFDKRERDRVGLTSGATVSTQAWRSFEAKGGLFGVDGVRHVIIPELTFRNTVGVGVNPFELIPIDDVEQFDNVQVFEFRMRSLLQTLWHRPSGTEVVTFIDLELEVPFFPNPRDNGDEPFGNLDVDLLVRFSSELQFVTDFEINWYEKRMEVANAAIGYTPSREFQAYAGFRHFEKTYDVIFLQTNLRLDEKWVLSLESGFDLYEDRGIDHRVVVSRVGPEWVIRLGFHADVGENDYGIRFAIEPRFLFDPVLRPSTLGAEPRLLYLGSGLRR